MAERPEILFPLFAELTSLDGIGKKGALLFPNIGIERPKDVLFHLPNGVIDRRLRSSITDVAPPTTISLEITVLLHMPATGRGRPHRVMVQDSKEVEFQLVFFNARDPWLQSNLPAGQKRIISGKIELYDGLLQMVHPDHILPLSSAEDLLAFEPVYALTAGVTVRTMMKATASAVRRAPELNEWIDPQLKAKRAWPDWQTAVRSAHEPQGPDDIGPTAKGRERLAYDEFFAHQVTLALARSVGKTRSGKATIGTGSFQRKILANIPFEPTTAQKRSVSEIAEDLSAKQRMNRLLQGDVGSGKTLVAVLAAAIVAEARGQAALMAPTEILARQHAAGIAAMVSSTDIRVEVLTGRDKGTARQQKLAALASGEIDLLIGTHALFQKDVIFQNLRLAIIDEQHRFGVRERMDLGEKGEAVDILVMTATPIPRSLELAHYGDMDLSRLDEKPPGRQPIETVLVSSGRLEQVTERMKVALDDGRQAYWVCPLVNESEVIEATAAEARFKSLRASLGEGRVGLVHGQMPAPEKDAAMARFISGETRLLVATTAIEVGVDVPNASIMVIEGADTFGLAQLHQLRGRVGRGSAASTCLLMYDPPLTEGATRRLETMRETEDGFRIAEEDLRLRGAGDVLGVAQSGLPRFRIANAELQTSLMQTAMTDARKLLNDDPDLTSPRGTAVRTLLHLMDQDKAFRLISVG